MKPIINELDLLLTELEAREYSNNCITERFLNKSWDELCNYGLELFQRLKEQE